MINCSSVSKDSAYKAGDQGLIPGLGRSPGEGNGNPLQYSFLENLMDRGAYGLHGVTRVRHDLTTETTNHQPWAKFLQCVFSVHPTPDESHWCSSRAPSRKTGPSATWWMLPVWKEWDSLLLIRASLVAQRVKSLLEVWETGVWSLSQEDPLEKEMATHSSILAWRIPWVEELGRLQSTRLQRVRHDWKTSLSLFSAI